MTSDDNKLAAIGQEREWLGTPSPFSPPPKQKPIDPSKLTPDQISADIDKGLLSPDTPPGANFNPGVDPKDVDDTFATGAKSLPNGAAPAVAAPENASSVKFVDMYAAFQNATMNVGSAQSDQWHDIAAAMVEAGTNFNQALEAQEELGQWTGKTHDAAIENLKQSIPEAKAIATGISTLSTLLDAFSHTIFQTQWYFDNWHPAYQDDLQRWPHFTNEINQAFDTFAQAVIGKVYLPQIAQIAAANPSFNSGQQVDVNTLPGGPTPPGTPPSDTGGPTPPPGGVGGANDPTSNLNTPNLSDLTTGPGGGGGLGDPGSGSPNFGAGLSDLAGGPSGGGLGGNFDSSQLPGGPNADLNTLPPPGGPGDGFDSSQLPGGLGGGASNQTPPDGFSPPDPNGVGSPNDQTGPPLPGDGANPGDGFGGNLPPGDGGNPGDGSGGNLPPGDGGNPGDGSGDLGGLGNLGSGPSGPGSPGSGGGASGLGNQLSSALGPASDALKAATGAGQSGEGAPGGVPGLDPKSLSANNGGPGAQHGGAGIGGRGLDSSRPGGVPVAGIGREPVLAGTEPSRVGAMAGQAGGAAGSGSGTPPPPSGGGQRGPTGKDHKTNKALRRKRNGELVIGEPDAVVAVIGDDGSDTEAAEPLVPQAAPPSAAPPARWTPPAANGRRPGTEQLRAELEL